MKYPRTLYRTLVFAAAVALLLGCGMPAATPSTTPPTRTAAQPRTVVIDTDMASDDWMAILYLFQRPDVSVKAITVAGTGEAHCTPGVRHAPGLAALAGYEPIPVACGRETPLQGSHAFPDNWRDQVDRLFGLTLPEGQNPASDLTAVQLLETVIQSSPDKVTMVTLGPLTNVAEALQQNPALADKIEMIYVMGGAVDVPGNIAASGVGIDNRVAEWNIYVDPHAANLVFNSGAPVTLVALDATNHAPLTAEFYERLEAHHKTPEATFAFDLYTQNYWLVETGGLFFWDQLTAAILTDDSLASYEDKALCVIEQEGAQSGWTKPGKGCPEVRVAVSADGRRFEDMFLATLNGE